MRRTWIALSTVAVMAACASCGSDNAGHSGGRPILGSTDQVSNIDPAGAYDEGSWQVFSNVFQTLLSMPPGTDKPQPDAAKSCTDNSDATVYHCVMRDGQTFSNGDPVTAEAAAYSIQRVMKINDPEGPSSLLSGIKSVSASGSTVTFRLSAPDATFPSKLTTGAAAIVDPKVYPATKELKGLQPVGSGVYEVKDAAYVSSSNKTLSHIDFVPNPKYAGSQKLANSGAEIKYYADANSLATALKKKQVDYVPHDLPPAVENAYENNTGGDYQTFEATSNDMHMLVFDTTHAPFNQQGVRQAVAQLVDREALVKDVYQRTVQPLYSLIPEGILGHATPFFDKYGASPDVTKAAADLHAAGIHTPVKFTITVSSGVAPVPEGQELAKQLNSSGLFSVTVKKMDWSAFLKSWTVNKLDAFTVGWSVDYPDPDDYVAPMLGSDNTFHNGYQSSAINSLMNQSRKVSDRQATNSMFLQIAKQEADDVPILPLWQSKYYAVSASNLQGTSLSANGNDSTCLWLISVGANS